MTEVGNGMEFVMNVSRVALAIDCDVGACRRANFADQGHPAGAHFEIRKFITTFTRYYLGSFTKKKSLSLCLP
jgi:hypothetical protein